MSIIKKYWNYREMNKTAKATIWFMLCSFIQRGITVLSTPIFTRILTTGEYGTFSVFSSWLEILTVIVTLRLCYGTYMRDLVKYPEERDEYSSSLLGLSGVLVIGWFLLYLFFHNIINKLLGVSFPMMICMFVMTLCSTWFGFWSSRERVDFNYKKLIAVTIGVSFLKPTMGVIFVLCTENSKVMARILSLTLVELVLYIGLFYSQMRKGRVFFQKNYWKNALKFNIPLVPHYLSQIILNHSDRIMIDYYDGAEAAGIYSMAYSMAMIMVLFNTSLHNSITPWNYQKLKNHDYDAMRKMGNLTIAFIAVINFVLILIAPEAIAIFSPPTYHEAIYIIPPVAMGVFYIFLYGLFVNVEMYYGKSKYVMIASITGAILNLFLNVVFIPIYGYIAAAYTTLISYIVYSVMHGLLASRIRYKENIDESFYDFNTIVLISLCFMVISFVIMATYPYRFIRYLIILAFIIICVLMKNKLINYGKRIFKLKKREKE